MEILLYILGGIGAFVVGLVLKGWALMTLWGWYIHPIFNLPEITIVQALGITLVGVMVTGTGKSSSYSDNDSPIVILIEPIFMPLFAVLLGWIFLQFS